VRRLAQIAYSDLPEAHQERYTYDAFVQCLNDLGLHHQLQARRVTTIEDALREGEAYLLVKQFHQTTAELGQDNPGQVAAVTTVAHLEAEVDRMTAMLEKLVAALARTDPTELTQGPVRPKVEVPRPAALCWRCGTHGHLRSSCPQPRKRLNFHGPRTPLNPGGQK